MLGTAVAQLSVALSIATGRSFSRWAIDRLVEGALDTAREFGAFGANAAEAVAGPALDEATRRAVAVRRFRAQAALGVRETAHYRDTYGRLGIDPSRIRHEDIPDLPLTRKSSLRADPGAFIRRSADVAFIASTTGTTGSATHVAYSARELHAIVGLSALAFLLNGQIAPDDVVQISTSSRAALGNLGLAGACARIGAPVAMVGIIDPAATLRLLARSVDLPGKKPRVSVLSAYPSYLGQLVEAGRRLGLGPGDFGLERIVTGGETVTAGLRRRAAELFGPVEIAESYAMTETIPFGGVACAHGHLHFEAARGLLEVIDTASGRPAGPGELGTIVATPFRPFRETTLLLRFDTEDVVRRITEPMTCALRSLPATTPVLGKLRLAVPHAGRWVLPRDVLEALEDLDAVPLPARAGAWAVPGGVAVEVAARDTQPATRRLVERALLDAGIPVRELHLTDDATSLRHPIPLRCDLQERSFGEPVTPWPDDSRG